jgi:O-6-methylguanine DNA methyltransferase
LNEDKQLVEKSALYFGETGKTPIGNIWLAVTEVGLAAVAGGMSRKEFEIHLIRRFHRPIEYDPGRVKEAAVQVRNYLARKRKDFTLNIDWSVLRPFQQAVLKATREIPYGETRTYKEIAEKIQRPGAARAVGRAEATNPMPLVLPCHRVIGCDGKLHGYGFGRGLKTKEWLLQIEGAIIT